MTQHLLSVVRVGQSTFKIRELIVLLLSVLLCFHHTCDLGENHGKKVAKIKKLLFCAPNIGLAKKYIVIMRSVI